MTIASASLVPGNIESLLVLLAAFAVVPFALSMATSFAKLVIVGGLIRNALGTPQTPPNTVITGIALILTLHIMSPVIEQTWINYEANPPAGEDFASVAAAIVQSADGPMTDFLDGHASQRNKDLFADLRDRLRDDPARTEQMLDEINRTAQTGDLLTPVRVDLVTVKIPAFVLTELTEAFVIGFLIFLPFLIIDLIVSNVLMTMGLMMMQPQSISLPLKILLFVLVDGWAIILQGVVLGYA